MVVAVAVVADPAEATAAVVANPVVAEPAEATAAVVAVAVVEAADLATAAVVAVAVVEAALAGMALLSISLCLPSEFSSEESSNIISGIIGFWFSGTVGRLLS